MSEFSLRLFLMLVLLQSVSACGRPGEAFSGGAPALPQAAGERVAPAATATAFGIDAGGRAVSPYWLADTGYRMTSAGGVRVIGNAIDTHRVTEPAPQAIYDSQRWAAHMTYTIDKLVPGARYRVRLHFVESFFEAAGKRLFDVSLNNVRVLSDFDIFRAAGGVNIAIVQQFVCTADAYGAIALALNASVNNASIAGIEIIADGASPPPAPTASPATHYEPSASPAPRLALNPNPFTVRVCRRDPCSVKVDAESATYNEAFFGATVSYLGRVAPNVPGDPSSEAFDAIPIYASAGADPAYTLACAAGSRCNNDRGVSQTSYTDVHIPSGAVADSASAQDYLFDVVDSAKNVEYNAYEFNTGSPDSHRGTMHPLRDGRPNPVYAQAVGAVNATCFAGSANRCFNGSAGSTPESADAVDPVEWLDQNIPHTLHIVPNCAGHAFVYPAAYSTGRGPARCPPFGAILWLDKTDAQIEEMPQPRWVKTLYHNLHDYGWIVLDNGPCTRTCTGAENGWYLQIVSDYTWTAVGRPSQWELMEDEMIAEGTTPRKVGNDPTWHYEIATPVDASITPANLHWLRYDSPR